MDGKKQKIVSSMKEVSEFSGLSENYLRQKISDFNDSAIEIGEEKWFVDFLAEPGDTDIKEEEENSKVSIRINKAYEGLRSHGFYD